MSNEITDEKIIEMFPSTIFFNGNLPPELDSFLVQSINRVYNGFQKSDENLVHAIAKTIEDNIPLEIDEVVPYPILNPKTADDWEKIRNFMNYDYQGTLGKMVDGTLTITLRQVMENHPGFDFTIDDAVLDAKLMPADVLKPCPNVKKTTTETGVRFETEMKLDDFKESRGRFHYEFQDEEFSFDNDGHSLMSLKYSGRFEKDPIKGMTRRLRSEIHSYGVALNPSSNYKGGTTDTKFIFGAVRYCFHLEFEKRLTKYLNDNDIALDCGESENTRDQELKDFAKAAQAPQGGIFGGINAYFENAARQTYESRTLKSFVDSYALFFDARNLGKSDDTMHLFRMVEEAYSVAAPLLEQMGSRVHQVALENELQSTRSELSKTYGYESPFLYKFSTGDKISDGEVRNILNTLSKLFESDAPSQDSSNIK